jgi:group I intron endonuclease
MVEALRPVLWYTMSMNKRMGIYAITNTANGKVYVGSTIDLAKRQRCHMADLRANRHDNAHLQAAYNLHGPDCFALRVLEDVANAADLIAREHAWMEALRSCDETYGYNLMRFATRPQHAPETRAKMSAAKKGKPHTPEHRANLAAVLAENNRKRAGRRQSPEQRAKTIEQLRKIQRTPESYAKAGAARRGKKMPPVTAEARAKMSAAHKGKPKSAEHRAKIAEANRGQRSAAFRATMATVARARSAEHRVKIAERRGSLTREQVITLRLRAAQGERTRALADAYGIAYGTASDIVAGRSWKHLL